MRKKTVRVLCAGLLAVSAVALVSEVSKPSFVRAFSTGSFVLEGDSVFWGTEKVTTTAVTETHRGEDYAILRNDKTYLKQDGQYYATVDDTLQAITASETELPGIIEIFDRQSVVSNYTYSALKPVRSYRTEIPMLPSGSAQVVCKEYQPKDPDSAPLRLYFRDRNLIAIRAKDDERFIFYVTSWSGTNL